MRRTSDYCGGGGGHDDDDDDVLHFYVHFLEAHQSFLLLACKNEKWDEIETLCEHFLPL